MHWLNTHQDKTDMRVIELSFIIINVLFAAFCVFTVNLANFSLSQSNSTLNYLQKLYSAAQIIHLGCKIDRKEQKTIAVKGWCACLIISLVAG